MYKYNMNKVSILIPCYNSEAFVAETLECCLKQTYTNIEAILVDDGSTDKSYEVAKQYESEKIKVYKQPNSGACVARNFAFEKSTGDYIMYLDADDLICENYVEALVGCLDGKGQDAIATGQWDRFRRKITEATFPHLNAYNNFDNGFELLLTLWQECEMLACSSYLVSRELITKVGGWDESVLKNQDGEFFARVLIKAGEIAHVPEAKFYYRTGDYLTVSKASSEKKVASMLDTFVSYKKNALAHEDSQRVREALSVNFTLFMYLHGNQYPALYERARQEVKSLGVGYILKSEPERVKQICKWIGFENFMKLRKIFFKR